MRLPNPEHCPKCGAESVVADTRLTVHGYRYRRRKCVTVTCLTRWNTYETLLNPRHLTIRTAHSPSSRSAANPI